MRAASTRRPSAPRTTAGSCARTPSRAKPSCCASTSASSASCRASTARPLSPPLDLLEPRGPAEFADQCAGRRFAAIPVENDLAVAERQRASGDDQPRVRAVALELQDQPAGQILDDLFLYGAQRAVWFDGHVVLDEMMNEVRNSNTHTS